MLLNSRGQQSVGKREKAHFLECSNSSLVQTQLCQEQVMHRAAGAVRMRDSPPQLHHSGERLSGTREPSLAAVTQLTHIHTSEL